MKDLWCHTANQCYDEGFKTMYKEKKKERVGDSSIERTLERIKKRKDEARLEMEEREREEREMRKMRMDKINQIKKLSNSPYSKIKGFYAQ